VASRNSGTFYLLTYQEAAFFTEDLIREQQAMFETMGTSDEAALKRARLQCANLISGIK
jgi:hypothetical protein